MNKHGFTLIELLGVVVVIGLISFLAIPNIVNQVKNKKSEIDETSVQLLKSATDLYISEHSSVYPTGNYASGSVYCIAIDSLVNDDYVEVPFKNANGEEIDYSRVVKATYNYNYFNFDVVNSSDCHEIKNYINEPELVDGMIPVIYDNENSNWVKASRDSNWYNYLDKKWANVVLVREVASGNGSLSRSEYVNAPSGTVINQADVLTYFVWIPRFRYSTFDYTVSYLDYLNKGIDIIFEKSTRLKSDSSDGYLTHPAFTFGNSELSGIWVGKFESSSSNSSLTDGGGNVNTLGVRVIPNVPSWRNISLANAFVSSNNMNRISNEYGISYDLIDSHVLKNVEWGSVAILSNSKYGLCDGYTCNNIRNNNSGTYITGCGASSVSSEYIYSSSTGYPSGCENAYNTDNGVLASTNGNITGIYDMSGGANESVMAFVSNNTATGIVTGISSSNNTGFSGSIYSSGSWSTFTGVSIPDSKYYDVYSYSLSNTDYSRRILGDATGEMGPFSTTTISSTTHYYSGWYDDYASLITASSPFMIRGGSNNYAKFSGLYNFNASTSYANSNIGFRVVLTNK